MRKTAMVSLSSFLFLMLASLVAYMLRYTDLGNNYIYWIIGAVLLVASALIAYFGAELELANIAAFLLSSLSLGFIIRAWYIFRGFDNSVLTMLMVSLASAASLWLFLAISKLPFFNRHLTPVAIIYGIVMLAAYVVVVFTTKTTFVSTFGFYMIVQLSFIYAIVCETEGIRGLIRIVTVCTFSLVGIAVIVLLMMLSGDGDCDLSGCDCGDCCDCGSREKKKGKTKKS